MKSLGVVGVFLLIGTVSQLLFAAESSGTDWIAILGGIGGLAALVAVITGFLLSRRKQIGEEKVSEIGRLTARIDKLEATNDEHVKEKAKSLEENLAEKATLQLTISEMRAEIKYLREALAELSIQSRQEARSDAASQTAKQAIGVAKDALAGVVREAAAPVERTEVAVSKTVGGGESVVVRKVDAVGKDVKKVAVDVTAIRHEVSEGVKEGVREVTEDEKGKK